MTLMTVIVVYGSVACLGLTFGTCYYVHCHQRWQQHRYTALETTEMQAAEEKAREGLPNAYKGDEQP